MNSGWAFTVMVIGLALIIASCSILETGPEDNLPSCIEVCMTDNNWDGGRDRCMAMCERRYSTNCGYKEIERLNDE